MPSESRKESVATKQDVAVTKAHLVAALSRMKRELIAWQLGLALLLFVAIKLIH